MSIKVDPPSRVEQPQRSQPTKSEDSDRRVQADNQRKPEPESEEPKQVKSDDRSDLAEA